jgi:non-ribosomal peptide synthase protein (TIGR01720 family)
MVPAAFVPLDALPLTPHGKVDRRALPTPDVSRPELRGSFVAPHSGREEVLAGIWCQILGLERVGVHDNFFSLGGDSILAIQIVARANQAGLCLTPKHLFQHQTIAELAAAADAAVAAASRAAAAEVGLGSADLPEQGPVTGPVPLTPIQHWFFEQDLPEPQQYNQSVLLKVRQPLDPAILEQALHHLAVHHDALRLRFVRTASGWQQFNAGAEEAAFPLDHVDLSALAEEEQGPALEAKAAELQAGLNLSDGPLARAACFGFGIDRPGRLLLAIHHLAVDGVSWRVLLEDLVATLDQLGQGRSPRLPPETTSFRRWADGLAVYAQSEAVRREAEYWLAEGRSRVGRLPVDFPGGGNLEAAAEMVAVTLTEDDTRGLLRELHEVYRTQVNDVLLTALARTLSDWTGSRTHLVDLESHGREEGLTRADLSRTVGWFTSIFPVLLELDDSTTPEEELKAVKEQLRRVPRGGVGYGLLRYLGGDTEVVERLRALPRAEVSFNYLGQVDRGLPESGPLTPARESAGPTHCPRGIRTHLLGVNGSVSAGRLRLVWTYGAELHRRDTIERLAEGMAEALRTLLSCCRAPGAGGYTPSDFPDANLNQAQLDKLRRKVLRTDGSRRS